MRFMDSKISFITKGKPISDAEVRGVLKGLKYFRQEYSPRRDLVDARFLDYSQKRLDTCL